jgi:hypothetical protein
MSNTNIEEIISMLIHDGFKYICNKKDDIVLYNIINKHNTIKWIKNLYNLFWLYPDNTIHINIYINKFKWIITLTYSQINNHLELFSKDLDDLFKIITNDNSEIIQRIYLKNKIENMM